MMELILRMPVKNLEFDPAAFEDLSWWIRKRSPAPHFRPFDPAHI